ncbi:MAG: DUF4199 family protein [Bacteroidetes bacterium]|jgi:hypothetical protein|nr:DUF4199 family protein [Bacteroidota bacterium]
MTGSQPSNKLQLAMTYGAYGGVAMLIITYLYSLRGNLFVSASDFFCYLALIVVISIGTRKYRDNLLGGYAKYSTILGMGTLISLFAAILFMFFNYVLLKYINKDLMNMLYTTMEEEFLRRGLSDGEVETMTNMYRMVLTPFMFGFIRLIQVTFVGFLFSLVIAFFVKKEGDPFKQDMQGIE